MSYTDSADPGTQSQSLLPQQRRRMSDSTPRAISAAEKMDALSAPQASTLSGEREAAMRYYLGDMNRDMPASDGRSRAVSSDVLDTIEGLMPTLMDIFCGSDEVMRFE